MNATSPSSDERGWNGFWFAQCYPHSLCLLRMFFGMALFLKATGATGLVNLGSLTMEFPRRMWEVSKMHDSWHMPYFSWLPLPDDIWLARIEQATLILSVLMIVGLFTRLVMPLLAASMTYMLLLSQWNHHHHIMVFVVVLWILAFSHCGQFFSLDAVVADPPSKDRKRSILPTRLIQVFVTTIYLFAFLWKCNSGWLSGEIMAILEQTKNLQGPLARWTIDHLGYQFLSLSTLAIEGLLPVCLWIPVLRRPAIALGLLMHLGIDSMMDIGSYSYQMMALYLAFINPQARATVVLFDGMCGMCRGSRRWATLMDWLCRVKWLSFRDAKVREMVPQLTDDQMEREMYVIRADGKTLPGFAGWRYLLNSFPLTFLPSWLLYLPGVSWLGRRSYQFVADRRALSCEIPRPGSGRDDVWQGTLRRAQATHSN